MSIYHPKSASGLPNPAGGSPGQAVIVNPAGDAFILGTVSGGGGAALDAAPSSPHALDDEFTTSALAAAWTTINTPGGGFTVDPDEDGTWLTLDSPGAASSADHLIRKALSGFAAGTAFSFWTKMRLRSRTGQSTGQFCTLSNNATYGAGSLYLFGFYETGGVQNFYTYDGSAVTVALPRAARDLYICIKRNTSNVVRSWISTDTLSWHCTASISRAWNADYLFVQAQGHLAASEASKMGIDFVRFDDSRLVLPA
jgi:hypothetical protein